MHYLHLILILIATGIVAGVIDTLAGGGGLISLPTLLLCGVPPTEALGTNKLQSMIGEFTAMVHYYRKGYLEFSKIRLGLIATAILSFIGGGILQIIHPTLLYKIMPFIMAMLLIYFALFPYLARFQLQTALNEALFYLLAGGLIGFYNGFFGPGTGSLWIFAFLAFQCYSIQQASIYGKALNVMANAAAMVWFIILKKVLYIPAFMMAIGQIIGAMIGSRLVIYRGNKLIRPAIIIVVGAMTIEMFHQAYSYYS